MRVLAKPYCHCFINSIFFYILSNFTFVLQYYEDNTVQFLINKRNKTLKQKLGPCSFSEQSGPFSAAGVQIHVSLWGVYFGFFITLAILEFWGVYNNQR